MQTRLFNIGTYLAVFIALADQMSKWLVVGLVSASGSVQVTSFLNLVLVHNKGVSFGLLDHGAPWTPYALSGLALAILAFLLRWLAGARSLREAVGLGLIMGGAVGNVIDRLRYGAVVDFIDFHVGGWHWYAFNVADSAIVLGVGLLLLDHALSSRKTQ